MWLRHHCNFLRFWKNCSFSAPDISSSSSRGWHRLQLLGLDSASTAPGIGSRLPPPASVLIPHLHPGMALIFMDTSGYELFRQCWLRFGLTSKSEQFFGLVSDFVRKSWLCFDSLQTRTSLFIFWLFPENFLVLTFQFLVDLFISWLLPGNSILKILVAIREKWSIH